MKPEPSSTDLVAAFIRAIEQRDTERALSMVTDDVEYDNVPIGKVFGPEGIRGVLAAGALAGADRLDWVIIRQVAQGDCVFNERLDRFRLRGRWIEVAVVGVFVLRAGRISHWRDYFDLQSFLSQMSEPSDETPDETRD